MRRWLGIVGLALVALAALTRSAATDDEVWRRTQRRDLVLGVPTEGELEAVESQQIGPPQVARIWNFQISMMVDEGAAVTAGEPVLGFDATELQQKLQQAMAEADGAAKKLEKLTTDLLVARRRRELRLAEAQGRLRRAELKGSIDSETTAAAELRKAAIDRDLAQVEISLLEESLQQHALGERLKIANLEGKVKLARSRVASLESGIEQMIVTASRSGTVVYKTNWRGEKKQVGERVWRAEKVLEIPDLSAMQASAEVDEANAGRLAVGQSVNFRLEAYPDTEYRATVVSIRRVVQKRSNEDPRKIVRLKLGLEESDPERMRPGMRFRGTIVTERVEDALTVPLDTIFSDATGSYVTLRGLFGDRQIHPELGRRNQRYVEVLAGLSEGDLLAGHALGEGAPE